MISYSEAGADQRPEQKALIEDRNKRHRSKIGTREIILKGDLING